MKNQFVVAFLATFFATGLCASSVFAATATSTIATNSSQSDLPSLILELQAQIKALQTRINELETELGVKPSPLINAPSASTTLPAFDRALSLGSTGDDVRNLQQFLAQDKEVYPEGLITAYYGPLTEKAVKKFQEKHQIISSGASETTGYGRIGPKTRSKLNELLTEGAGKSGKIPPGLLTAPGIQKKVATTTPATTPSTTLGTSTPSGTIPATPAQPIGQTGTTTVPATPAQPTTGTPPPPPPGGTTPPPNPTPSPTPPPPSTATTTPLATPPPSTTDTMAPTISNVQATNITTSSATITWTTNELSDSWVEYGVTTAYGFTIVYYIPVTTNHSVTLSALSAGTTYHFRVKSTDAAGNLAMSGDYTFTTSAPPAQCNDALDNDGDGKIDMNDLDCTSPTDNNESFEGLKKITITVPNGNNQWIKGQTYQIQWSHPLTAGFSGDTNLNWEVVIRNGYSANQLALVPVTQTYYTWIVSTRTDAPYPSAAPPGSDYEIIVTLKQKSICSYNPDPPCQSPSILLPDGIYDVSDARFTIVSSSVEHTSFPSLASLFQSIFAALDDIQKQIQKLR